MPLEFLQKAKNEAKTIQLYFGGFLLYRHKVNIHCTTWRCTYKRGCRASVSTNLAQDQVNLKPGQTLEEFEKHVRDLHLDCHPLMSREELECLRAEELCKIQSQKTGGETLYSIYSRNLKELNEKLANDNKKDVINKKFRPHEGSLRNLMEYYRRAYEGPVARSPNSISQDSKEKSSPEPSQEQAIVMLHSSSIVSRIEELAVKRLGRPPKSQQQKVTVELYDLNALRRAAVSPVSEAHINFAITKLAELFADDIGFVYPHCAAFYGIRPAGFTLKNKNIILHCLSREWFVLTNLSSSWELHGVGLNYSKANRFAPLFRKISHHLGQTEQEFPLTTVSFRCSNFANFDSGLWAIAHAVNLCFGYNMRSTRLDMNALSDHLKECFNLDKITPFEANEHDLYSSSKVTVQLF